MTTQGTPRTAITGAGIVAIKFDHYGDIDVLEVREVPRPSPGPGEVLVQAKAAGINPGEAMIRKGALHDRWPATFPSGQGSDLAAQRAGATVLGIAACPTTSGLSAHGVIPVSYGDDLADRLRTAAPNGLLDAFLNFFGGGYVELAVTELGVPPQRVDTIIDFAAIEKFGVKAAGNLDASDTGVLVELANLVAAGDSTYRHREATADALIPDSTLPLTAESGCQPGPDPRPVRSAVPFRGGDMCVPDRETVQARPARWADQRGGKNVVPTPCHVPARVLLRHHVFADEVLPAVPSTGDRKHGGTPRLGTARSRRGGPGRSAVQHGALLPLAVG